MICLQRIGVGVRTQLHAKRLNLVPFCSDPGFPSTTQKGVEDQSQKNGSNPVGAPSRRDYFFVKNRAETALRSYDVAFDVDLESRSGLPRSAG